MLEDSALDAELICVHLGNAGLRFVKERVWTRDDYERALALGDFDVILADHVLPAFDGDTALELAAVAAPDVPFIFVSGTLSEEAAVRALKKGAVDYVVKQRLQRLPDAVERAFVEAQKRRQLAQAQAGLARQRAQLELITDSLPALIAHLDPQHRFLFSNRNVKQWLGLASEQVLHRTAEAAFGEEIFPAIRPHLERAAAGARVSFQARLDRRDPDSMAQVDCVPEFSDAGQVSGYYLLAIDVTSLKKAQTLLELNNLHLESEVSGRTRDLQRSQETLAAIFESAYQLQQIISPDGTILDANRASLAAVMEAKDKVVGLPYATSPWFSGTDGASELIDRAVERGRRSEHTRYELELNLPTGRRSFDFSLRPLLDRSGAVSALVAEALETTERRHAEHALRQAQKIEAVGQLTGGVAHDFNNILTIITGNIDQARLMLDNPKFQHRVPRALDSAQKAVLSAASLTQRLLAFSRRQPLKSRTLSVNRHLSEWEDMLRRALGELIRLEVVQQEDLWLIEVDPSQLEASILNLLVNARDAMPHGGTLELETSNGLIDELDAAAYDGLDPGEYVLLRVTDSGAGMSEQLIGRIFEPFFTTKEVGRGTGLGLSMVYGFVKQSKGHVVVRSAPGKGTTFTLMFPRSTGRVAEEESAGNMALDEASCEGTILVAEDNDDVRAYVVETLRYAGYRVLEAQDGASALDLLSRPDRSVDLLFSDIVMPGMSGWELAHQARAIDPDLRVLFASGYPRDIDMDQYKASSTTIVAKPFTRSKLLGAIAHAIAAKDAPRAALPAVDP
jgi:PAS domain S-box-containing protein